LSRSLYLALKLPQAGFSTGPPDDAYCSLLGTYKSISAIPIARRIFREKLISAIQNNEQYTSLALVGGNQTRESQFAVRRRNPRRFGARSQFQGKILGVWESCRRSQGNTTQAATISRRAVDLLPRVGQGSYSTGSFLLIKRENRPSTGSPESF